MRRNDLVLMRHPGVNGTYRAPRKAVRFWEKHGWTKATETGQAPKASTAKSNKKKEA